MIIINNNCDENRFSTIIDFEAPLKYGHKISQIYLEVGDLWCKPSSHHKHLKDFHFFACFHSVCTFINNAKCKKKKNPNVSLMFHDHLHTDWLQPLHLETLLLLLYFPKHTHLTWLQFKRFWDTQSHKNLLTPHFTFPVVSDFMVIIINILWSRDSDSRFTISAYLGPHDWFMTRPFACIDWMYATIQKAMAT